MDECPVCLDGINNLVTPVCGHKHCASCLKKLLSKDCTICRKPLTFKCTVELPYYIPSQSVITMTGPSGEIQGVFLNFNEDYINFYNRCKNIKGVPPNDVECRLDYVDYVKWKKVEESA